MQTECLPEAQKARLAGFREAEQSMSGMTGGARYFPPYVRPLFRER